MHTITTKLGHTVCLHLPPQVACRRVRSAEDVDNDDIGEVNLVGVTITLLVTNGVELMESFPLTKQRVLPETVL